MAHAQQTHGRLGQRFWRACSATRTTDIPPESETLEMGEKEAAVLGRVATTLN